MSSSTSIDSTAVKKLGDFISLQRGTTYKSALLGQPGAVLIGLASIEREGGFRSDKLETYGGECPQKISLKPGDLYVSLKDITHDGHLLGAVARIPNFIEHGRLTQDTVKLVFEKELFPRNYIYWLLRTPQYRNCCRSRQTGTTNLGLSREDFLSLPVPPMTEATNAIVIALESIEKKIENLRRQSETLERIAQTLFKHWFVDFEFPNEDGKPYKSSGGEMVRSELGEIPVGWRVAPFETTFLIPLRNGLTKPRSVRGSGFYMVNMGELFGNKRIGDLEMDRVELSDSEYEKSLLEVGDILFARQSLVREGAGQCSIITEAPEPRTFEGHLIRCRIDRKKANPFYFFYHFWSFAGGFQMRSLVEQVAAAGIRGSELAKLEVMIPPIEFQDKFFAVIEPLEKSIALNFRRIRTLTKARDVLLPKLMSGKIRL